MRSDAADSSRETVRMKGGQSREVESRESQREGVEKEQRKARDVGSERSVFKIRDRGNGRVDREGSDR